MQPSTVVWTVTDWNKPNCGAACAAMLDCAPYIVQLLWAKYLKDHLISDEHCRLGNLQYNLCSVAHFKSSQAYDTGPCKPISDNNYFPLTGLIQLDLIQFEERGHIVYVLIQSFLIEFRVCVFLTACFPPVLPGALSALTSLKAAAWPPVLLSLKRSIHFHNYDTRWPFLTPLPTAGVTQRAFQTQSWHFKWTHTSWSPAAPLQDAPWEFSLTLTISPICNSSSLFLSVTKPLPPPPPLLCHYNDTDTGCIVLRLAVNGGQHNGLLHAVVGEVVSYRSATGTNTRWEPHP